MVIKLLFVLFIIPITVWSQTAEESKLLKEIEKSADIDSAKYSKSLKEKYFHSYQTQADNIIHSHGKPSEQTLKEFDQTEGVLAALEYEEGKVDQISEQVEQHLKAEEAKEYHTQTFAFADFISWQQDFSIKTPVGKKSLIATNKGYCAGAGYSYHNANYHFFSDGCFLYFRGDAATQNTTVTYHQSDVYGYGFKLSVGAGMYVSSAKAEVGFKIPLMYTRQDFDDPNQATFPGTKISQPRSMNSFASLYTRWPFDRWFFQTEFGKRLDEDLTLWSLGFGYKF